MSDALIEARGLCKAYTEPHRVRVLDGLDLAVSRGEAVAITGQSGVGKSTLLHILGALDRPTGGSLRLDGTELTALDDRRLAALRNRYFGFIFQFHHLLPDFSALENVMMPALIAGLARGEAEARASAVLAQVGLEARLAHRPGELSGGEQQRVAVARALANKPMLLLADEPTGNLDPTTAADVHRLLLALNRERGITLVMVTHNQALAALATRTLRLAEGRLH